MVKEFLLLRGIGDDNGWQHAQTVEVNFEFRVQEGLLQDLLHDEYALLLHKLLFEYVVGAYQHVEEDPRVTQHEGIGILLHLLLLKGIATLEVILNFDKLCEVNDHSQNKFNQCF